MLVLRAVAVADPVTQAAAVALGGGRLGDELIPVIPVRREDAAIAHDEGDAGWMQVVL
jgi:hypothetical protein